MAWLCSLAYTTGCFFSIINIGIISSFLNESRFKLRKNAVLIIALIIIFFNCLSDTALTDFSPQLVAALYCLHYLWFLFCCINQCGKKYTKRALYLFGFLLSFSSLFEEITNLIISEYFEINNRFYIPWTIFFIYSFIFYLILKRVSNKNLSVVRLNLKVISNRIYILILADFFIAGGLVSIQNAKADDIIQQMEIVKALTILFILISIIIIITTICSVVSKSYYERQSNLLEQQIESELSHYERIGILDSELRTFRHDYKNHLLCIRSLVDEKQYDDLEEYISQITNASIVNEKVYATGNKIADIILSEKNKKAEQHNCSISFLGEISEKITSKDVCIILSNSLDNAIEACEKNTEHTSSVINVKATYSHNMQLLEVSNPIYDKIWIENKSIATTKSDKKQHGFGLYNIRQVAKKHDGIFDIHIDKGNFIIEIGLNLQ